MFAAVGGIFINLKDKSFKRERKILNMKNIKYKLNSWVITAVVIIAVILVNLIITTLSAKIPLKIDMTKGQQFEITLETKNILKDLDRNIQVSVIGTEDQTSPLIKEYIDRYKSMSNKLSVTYVDIYKNQPLLYSYEQKGEKLSQSDILLECEGNYKIVAASTLTSQTFSPEEGQQNYSFELESKFTNAIVTVSGMMTESKVYFLEGHGEQQSTGFLEIVKTQGHKTETISIVNGEIPEDAKLLIAYAPSADFSLDECERIDKFLEKGGNFLVTYMPGVPNLERLSAYLSEWGITPENGIVLEKDQNYVMQDPAIFIPTLIEHETTKNLISKKLSYIVAGSISFKLSADNTQRATVKSVMTSTNKAIAKTGAVMSSYELEEGDIKGPFNLIAVSERTYPEVSRVIAIGATSSLEVSSQYEETRANVDFAANLISYMTNNTQNLQIAPKIITTGQILPEKLTSTGITLMYLGLVWILPIIVIVIGLVVWLRRRYL